MLNQEQLIAQQQAQIETLLGLSHKAFEGIEKLVELNLQAVKAALQESAEHTHALMHVKDGQEFVQVQTNFLQPLSEKASAYSRHVYDIAQDTANEFLHAAETQVGEARSKFNSMVESTLKNAPAGTEHAAEFVKSALNTANGAYEQAHKAAKHAAETAHANVESLSKHITQAAQSAHATKPAAKSRKAAAQ
jgi:phasin family protein